MHTGLCMRLSHAQSRLQERTGGKHLNDRDASEPYMAQRFPNASSQWSDFSNQVPFFVGEVVLVDYMIVQSFHRLSCGRLIFLHPTDIGFPGGSDRKESAHKVGHWALIPGLGRSPGEETPVFLTTEFHGQRSLVGYSPWGRKEWTRLSN